MDFLCYFIMPFSVVFLCQIRADANDVCDSFNIFVAKSGTWNFTGLFNVTFH